MKKLTYFIITLSLIVNSASALEKKDCSELKKLSKAFIACKSNNLKAGLTNAGSNIKKNTIGKIKKKNNSSSDSATNKKTKVLKEKVSKTAKGFKKKTSGIFSGTTKQYPKGVKK